MLKAISTPLDGVQVFYGWTPLGLPNHKKHFLNEAAFHGWTPDGLLCFHT